MTLRAVVDRFGREVLREIGAHEWAAYKKFQDTSDRLKSRIATVEVQKMIKDEIANPVERILIDGTPGYWIQAAGPPAGDGRQLYKIFDPDGEHLTNVWGKDAAEAAARSHASTGKITHGDTAP